MKAPELVEALSPFISLAWDNGMRSFHFPYELEEKRDREIATEKDGEVQGNNLIVGSVKVYTLLDPPHSDMLLAAERMLKRKFPDMGISLDFRTTYHLERYDFVDIPGRYHEREIVTFYEGTYIRVDFE